MKHTIVDTFILEVIKREVMKNAGPGIQKLMESKMQELAHAIASDRRIVTQTGDTNKDEYMKLQKGLATAFGYLHMEHHWLCNSLGYEYEYIIESAVRRLFFESGEKDNYDSIGKRRKG